MQVKSGNVQRNQIATLKSDMEREKADLALSSPSRKPAGEPSPQPTRPMNDEAIGAGFYVPEAFPDHNYPRGADAGDPPHHRGAACRRTSRIPSLRARGDIPASAAASEPSPPGTACIDTSVSSMQSPPAKERMPPGSVLGPKAFGDYGPSSRLGLRGHHALSDPE